MRRRPAPVPGRSIGTNSSLADCGGGKTGESSANDAAAPVGREIVLTRFAEVRPAAGRTHRRERHPPPRLAPRERVGSSSAAPGAGARSPQPPRKTGWRRSRPLGRAPGRRPGRVGESTRGARPRGPRRRYSRRGAGTSAAHPSSHRNLSQGSAASTSLRAASQPARPGGAREGTWIGLARKKRHHAAGAKGFAGCGNRVTRRRAGGQPTRSRGRRPHHRPRWRRAGEPRQGVDTHRCLSTSRGCPEGKSGTTTTSWPLRSGAGMEHA